MNEDLSSCKTTPSPIFEASRKCKNLLNHRFRILSALGDKSGFGIVYAVQDTQDGKKKAVKVIGYSTNSLDELGVACTLSDYRKFLPAFPLIYGWIPCPEPPRDWVMLRFPPRSAVPYWEAGELLYYVMEFLDGKVVDLVKTAIDEIDILSLLFELFYSLLFAKVELGLVHGDIKDDNVMYKIVTQPRVYTVGKETYVIESKYMPVLIDPGLAVFAETPFDTDIGNLTIVLIEGLYNESSVEGEYLQEHFGDFQTRLDVPLERLDPIHPLQSTLFNVLIMTTTDPNAILVPPLVKQ